MSKPLHERLVNFADGPTRKTADAISGSLVDLASLLDYVTADLEEYAEALDDYRDGDRDEKADAREAFASSDLAHDLTKLGRFLDGLETETVTP